MIIFFYIQVINAPIKLMLKLMLKVPPYDRHVYDRQLHDRQFYDRQLHDRQYYDRQLHDHHRHDRQNYGKPTIHNTIYNFILY